MGFYVNYMNLKLDIFLSLAISFTIVFFVIPKIIKVSFLKNIFDTPNHRSASKRATPSLGGIAIFAGFIIATFVASNNLNVDGLKYLFVGCTAMFVVGLKDDIIGFAARKKFFIQFIVAFYLVFLGHFRITNFHGVAGIYEVGSTLGSIVSVIAIVGIINAVNLIDGIDGLASGITILISVVYGVILLNAGDVVYALMCFSLVGSLIAFFLYNVFGHSNKIFMGDTGSLILGTVIAILTIHFNEINVNSDSIYFGAPAISFAIIIVPVIDTLRVFAIRLYQGKSPFTPDMNHIHHKLLRLTNSHLISSLIIISTNALIIWLAFVSIEWLGNAVLFYSLLILGFILASIPSLILKFYRKEEKERQLKALFTFFLFQNKKQD
jgi:UDP-N-acetylmuramyl pentapeptide phosphotransferase/UDP-N-acetylglucosamine-1-phosphate transferase